MEQPLRLLEQPLRLLGLPSFRNGAHRWLKMKPAACKKVLRLSAAENSSWAVKADASVGTQCLSRTTCVEVHKQYQASFTQSDKNKSQIGYSTDVSGKSSL